MLPCALEALRASEAQNQRAHVMLQTRCSRRDAQLQVLTQRLQEREFVMRAENSRQIEEFSSKFRALQQHLHSQVFMRAMDHLCQSVTEFKGLHSLFGTATQLARALEQIDSKESELQHLQHELEQLQLSHALAASRLAEMERQVEEGRMREGDFIAHEKEHELALAAAKASALSLSLSLPSGTTPKTADVPQGIPFDFELSGAHKLDPPPRPPRIRTPPTYDECEVI